ncbi:MAG: hypothetical protein AB2748_03675 [Candidatus Thiodiazotropha endolucinida]
MKQKHIYLAIGILQLITGISGGGLMIWALFSAPNQSSGTFLIPLYLAFSIIFILGGILLIKGNIVGVWLSVMAQLIAIPSYVTAEFSFGFNNVVHLFFQLSNDEKVMSIDIVSSLLFFYLALSVPESNGRVTNDG